MMAMPGQCYIDDVCVICLIKFSESTDAQVTLGEKGLNSLISCSKAAGDLQLEEYLSSYKGNINVHVSCRHGGCSSECAVGEVAATRT